MLLERALIAAEGDGSRSSSARSAAAPRRWLSFGLYVGVGIPAGFRLAVIVSIAILYVRGFDHLAASPTDGFERPLAAASAALPTSIPKEKTLESWHGTTILGVKKGGKTVIAGDGQVSMGNTVMKPNAKKVRRIGEDGRGDRRLRRRDRRRLHPVRAAGDASSSSITAS